MNKLRSIVQSGFLVRNGMCLSTYNSSISLSNLYPSSTLKLTTPTEPPKANEKFNGYIPIDRISVTYSRSSGPGGQNVNKVNTKVDLRFHLQSADWLSEEIRSKLAAKLENRLTKDGFVVFKSDLTRSQQLNLADCLEKARTSIRSVCQEAEPLSEETQEKIRRKREKAARERLYMKRERSQVKNERQGPLLRDL